MRGRKLLAVVAVDLALSFGAAPVFAEGPEPGRTGQIAVNGVEYYYETHGEGEPLLLLHGGLGTFEMFTPILPELTESRQVIGVDLYGHGRTQLVDGRPMDLTEMGRDMAALVEGLGYERVDVMGYSLGGGVAGQMAAQQPERVRRLVVLSAPFERAGFHDGIQAQMEQIGAHQAEAMKGTPMYQAYANVAPDVTAFPDLLDAVGDLLSQPDSFTLDVEALEPPVMLVYGDGDMIRLEHMVEFYKRLGGGQRDAGWERAHMPENSLAILPNLTHYELFGAPAMVRTVLPFLNGEKPDLSWANAQEAAQ
ncbi:alpha/beta fold hydrolase [Fodinicurvata fenggangensis]|uniref:alpha/beta fold hydrolase n=1 Tax=Fodinicurvata fenggangensis TaxID=1121830 RepID=UPI000478F7A7|nr:alpha/beta hydrolase [Fodinicurvata fenggangensis]